MLSRLENGTEAHAPPECPSLCNYNAAMMAVARAGQLDKIQDVFSRLKARGFTPDSFTYAAAIAGCARRGENGEARRLFEEAVRSPHVTPTVEMYGTMLDAYAKVFFWGKGTQGMDGWMDQATKLNVRLDEWRWKWSVGVCVQ